MTAQKHLYRDTQRGLVGGVLAGLAHYFDQDIVLCRVLAIILFILTGFMPGILVYVIAWVIIPAQPTSGEHYDYDIV